MFIMKRVVLFSVFVFSMFMLFSCSDDKKKEDQVIDNRLPSSEVLELLKSNLLDKEGNPIGISDGQVETNRELAVGGALEAIVCYSATHEGIEFLLPWKEGDAFSYIYTLRDDRGTISIKSSDKDGFCAEMTLRVPEFNKVTRIRFMKWNAFWHENNSEIPTSLDGMNLGTSTSVSFMFAKLQQEMAILNKESATKYQKEVEEAQKEQKEVAGMLQRCRELQNQAKESGTTTEMPADIRAFMDKNNLAYDLATPGVENPTKETADSWHDKDGWDVAIQSLQGHQEAIGTRTQALMVLVQDAMRQYVSYLQGAEAIIRSENQTLSSILRGV